MKNNKGITIIALVVTIIVLLILSSISISYVVNKNGIIDNVNSNKENAEIKSIESKLQVESTSFNIQNNGKLNLDKYMRKVEKLDEWKVTENDEEDEIEESVKKNVKEVVVNDKYVFEIKLDNEGIKIEYLGKKGKLGPRVIWHTYSNTYDTLTLNVVTRRNKGGTIQYWIKERGSGEYELKSDQLGNTYTFTGLDIDKKYTIQVIAKKDDKQSAPYIIDVDMVKLPELTDENTKFIKTPESWTNGNVTVTAQTKMTGYTIQTSQDKENWKNIAYQIVEKNGKVYARLSDGYNSGKVYETDITNIDKLAPNEFTPTATSTTKSITVIAKNVTDAAAANGSGSSGIAGYRFSLDNGSTWTAYQNKGEYTWDKLQQTTNYTIKVEAKDNAGNVRQESVSKGTGTVETATGGTYSPTTWTNGNVKVTLPTKSGFTTRYTIDGTKPTKDSTQYTGEFTVSSNCTITYLYTDGTNIGGTGSLSVTNIDTAPPTINEALSGTGTTNSITLSMSVSDSQSGVKTIKWYYKLSTDSSYTEATDNYTETTSKTTRVHTFTGLTQGKTYNAYAVVYDAVGRETRSSTINVNTEKVTDLTSANVKFTYNPSGWTSGSVKVTAALKDMTSSYTLKIVDSNPLEASKSTALGWANASTGITVSTNKTVYAVLVDSEGQTGAATTGGVTNIDTAPPTINEALSGTGTTNSITLSMSVSDSQSGVKTIKWYYKLSTDSSYTEATDNYTETTSETTSKTTRVHTFTGLTQGKTYNAYAVVYDAVGRETRSSTINVNTEKVTDLTSANVKFTYNPSGWTSGSVKVTAALKDMTSSYTLKIVDSNPLEASKSTALGWANASTGITVSTNKTVYAVLVDSEGQTGAAATGSVTNIDKLAPNTFTPTLTYKELKDASYEIKNEYNYKGSFTPGPGVDKYFAYNNTYAGEIYYFAGNYYLCIKSALAGFGSDFTSPEYFKVIGSTYRVDLTISTDVADAAAANGSGQSGIKEYYFGKIKDDKNEWEWTDAKSTSIYKFTDLVPGATYQFRIKVIDNAGNERESGGATGALKEKKTQTVTTAEVVANPSKYYGKTVTDHKSTNGWSGWKIFYAQGSYVYLIADDYVPNSLIKDSTGMELNGNYQARWETSNPPAMQNVGSSRTIFKGTRYTLNQNYPNSKCASTLLRTSNWSNFLSSNKSGLAIGGPTIEMWMASWNQIYPNDKLYCNSTNTYGYRVGTSSTPSTEYIDYNVMNKKEGYKNKLYYPHNISSAWNGVYTYWTCSPSAFVYKNDGTSGERLINIDNRGYVGSDPYYFYTAGIRPVVRMKSGVSMEIIK